MLDKSIKYHRVIMKREKGMPLQEFLLPEGYSYKEYTPGDELAWAEIETSVGEFVSKEKALAYFKGKYMLYRGDIERRCFFVESSEGRKVATFTLWWGYTGLRRDPWLHWVAVMPEYQDKLIGKALVYEAMRRFMLIEGDRDIYLATQTWSYKAINIYRKQGFVPTGEQDLGGFNNTEYEQAMELIKGYMR